MNQAKTALVERGPVPEAAVIITCGLDPETHWYYESLFDGHGWRVQPVNGAESLYESLRADPAAVLICAADHPEGGWRTLLEGVLQLERPPAFIVVGESSIWNEVLAAGAFDLIAHKRNRYEVLWTISAAWHEWTHRHERQGRRVRCSDA